MPELPEVEYVARQLREELIGRRILRAEVYWPRAISGMDPQEFEARMTDRRVTGIGRRAKYLLIALDGDETLILHRRMSGNVIFARPDDDDPYIRVAFPLDDGRRLLFTDPRKFGRLTLAGDDELPAVFAALGPEPLDATFTPALLADRLRSKRGPIKATLLDQSVIGGLGNIYADESLFAARIHPLRPANSLAADELRALHAAIQSVLTVGIAHGGATFGRHRDVYNQAGTSLEHARVYKRAGQPCPRCGAPIERIVVVQRGTHFCPTCQRMGETHPPLPDVQR